MTEQYNIGLLAYLTTDIVSTYVANNKMSQQELPDIIRNVHGSLALTMAKKGLGSRVNATNKPFVEIEKSIQPDFIVCLEDGRKLKMLKRYLRTQHNLTPEQYRAKWGLKADYPMVAPNYAKKRSEYAKKIGLGKNRAKV